MQWTQSTDEHVRSYVNGIPTGSGGTHENGFRAGLGKAVRNFIETHNLSPERGDAHRRGHPRRAGRACSASSSQEPQFQGQTKDRLNNPEVLSAVDSQVRPALEHWLNTNISVAESIVARIILAARAREASRAAQQEVVRKGPTSEPPDAPRQAQRLQLLRPRRERALHRRRRLGRRIGEAGPRSRAPGDPAAARQGAEHRERVDREGPREQGAVGSRHRARLRHRQELRPGAAALRPRHHPRRRRLRRPPHRHAAPDVHVPAHARADHRRAASSWRSRRSTASTSARKPTGRWTTRIAIGC